MTSQSAVSGSPAPRALGRAMAGLSAPTRLLGLAFVIALSVVVGLTLFCLSQPYLGLRMSFDARAGGAVVTSAQGPAAAIPLGTVITAVTDDQRIIRLEPTDLTGQVDGSFGPHADYLRFMDRQGQLAGMQRGAVITFIDRSGAAWPVRPGPRRPITTLEPSYWSNLVVGVFAWLTSAAIWVFRPRETSARYLLLSGASTLMFAPLGASYTSRELALPREPFFWINSLNFLGGCLFSAALLAMLLYYPRKLAPRWVGMAIVGVFLAWFTAQHVGLFPDLTFARRILSMGAILGTFVLSAIHWRLTRRDPIARAALGWFLISWVVVVAVFAGAILAPQMFGVDTSAAEPWGFLLFLLLYAGLAFGIMRYRLFDLGQWWGRVIGWTLGLIALAGLDLLFLAGLHLSSSLSLALSLLICGLVWLPFRNWLWTWMFGRRAGDDRALFESIVQIGLTRAPEAQARQWSAVLQGLFDPLHMDVGDSPGSARLDLDGLALVTPAIGAIPSLRLEYAHGGRSLFTPRDVARAAELTDMLRHVFQSRGAYEEGVAGERKRIASDIHDNLGASLLSALHTESGERKDQLIRETLSDLRSIVANPARPGATLAEAVAQIRRETADRLSAAGVALRWPVEQHAAAALSSPAVHALRSALREAVSNIIRHAQARTVIVSVRTGGGAAVIVVEDDGLGFDVAAVAPGAGLGNIRGRITGLGGAVAWSSGAEGRGTRLTLTLPLDLAPS